MTLHNGFPSTSLSPDFSCVGDSCTAFMNTFDALSVSENKQLLKGSPSAFCEADHMPTWFAKQCQDIFIGPIANKVNYSLYSVVFPLSMKVALVKPLTERYNFGCNVLKEILYTSFKLVLFA